MNIYKQYNGVNDDSYYFTFNENDVNHVGKYPIQMPLTKENIVLTILSTQTTKDEDGNYVGYEFFTSKTQGMKFKKAELMEMLEKCYNLYNEVREGK